MVVWLTLSPSARVTASNVEDLEQQYPYQYWIPDDQCLILSKVILDGDTLSAGNGVLIKNPTTGAWVSTVTTTYYSLYSESYNTGDFLRLYYNDITGWEAWLPDQVRRTTTNWTIYYSAYGSGTLPAAVYTNGVSLPSPFTSAGTTLPSDIPPFENVQEAINNTLNASTGITTQANYITSNIQNQTQKFENGEISQEVFELNINMALEVLDELQNTSGNTLADQIAINNALTATQTAQDKLVTQDLIDALNEKFQWTLGDMISASELVNNVSQEIVLIYDSYINGQINKREAIGQLATYQLNLESVKSQFIDSGSVWTTANESVLSGIKDFIEQTQENVNNYGDINNTVANQFKSSELAEKDYLNDLTSETTASIQDISPKDEFSDSELGAASNIMQIIWDNKFVKSLLVICGCFMVVCVVLGIRYKV